MPTERLTVSLIITTYNRANLVTQAIDSVLSQTRAPDEIIVIDDGSSDDTQTVLSTYNPPVRVIRRENGGLSAARNTGLEYATSDLIAFLDDDDTLTPNSIEDRARFLEENSAIDVVYGEISITDLTENARVLFGAKTGIPAPSGNVFAAFAERNRRPVHAFMFRRSVIERVGIFDTTLSCLEDYDFWLRVSAKSQFQYMPQVVGNYRFHGAQMTSLRRRMAETEITVRESILETPAFTSLTPIEQSRVFVIQGTQYAQLGEITVARHWYQRARHTAPDYFLPKLLMPLTLFGRRGIAVSLLFFRLLRRSYSH